LPGVGSQPEEQQDLSIEYSRQNLTRLEDGRLVATVAEDLVIRPDRSAVYRNLTGGSDARQFTISSDEMNSLKGLVITTGFMQVDGADYPQKEGLGNLTKYTLKLRSGADSKTITWVDIEASQGADRKYIEHLSVGVVYNDDIPRGHRAETKGRQGGGCR
jgi:hypothetical protein